MNNPSEFFGSMVFSEKVMREKLPPKVYENLRKSIDEDSPVDAITGEIVAQAMKEWAIEKGATHFTHWFQPLTEVTAEKHNSFLELAADGDVEMNFSVKELIKGESDASSFPSGGLRATFEARGYTSWDPTSFAFVKNQSLYIPSFFCSYGGEVLDEKTPLLKSIYAVSKQSVRILKLLGDQKVNKVIPSVGAEQEYFIVDKNIYNKRKDLVFCGRTLFGAPPVKAQDLSDHYFGALKPRIMSFMQEVDEELWKLGVPSKTKHNEVAPAQHEVAQIYSPSNLASDQNHIIMETLKVVANRHNLVCLLHEKPFKGINGSGKHNNWSLITNTGVNLLEPGNSPKDNVQFLVFLCAVIKAVDEYADLLRIAVSSYSNDKRLGGQEAPPSIISIYLGDELMEILESIERGEIYTRHARNNFKVGLNVLLSFPCDTSDRNRTSPFAFTGNKFEFRMVGSSQSISSPNMIMNTIVAQALKEFADELESYSVPSEHLNELLVKTIKKHKRIIFSGNSYSPQWEEEAGKRGLNNFRNSVEALEHSLDEKNVQLFETHGVLSERELTSRYEIHLENYCKTVNIESKTLLRMVKCEILPAVSDYTKELSDTIIVKSSLDKGISTEYETNVLRKLSELSAELYEKTELLETCVMELKNVKAVIDRARKCSSKILEVMEDVRSSVDKIEELMPSKYWPYPTYEDIIYSV